MRVNMVFIHMDADDRLIAPKVFFTEPLRDLQRLLCPDFSRREGLDDVVTLYAIRLAGVGLGLFHGEIGVSLRHVVIGRIDSIVRLIPVEHIVYQHIRPGAAGENFSNRHYLCPDMGYPDATLSMSAYTFWSRNSACAAALSGSVIPALQARAIWLMFVPMRLIST
ncbi:hypothetical protein SDC9_170331 [bioreactor metagenome]|uniref:Uncharacterized protein n=1 Tax=bioreactor metagenome TaxID=1076179 RepID=A0A645G9Y9_9ZZZZ